MKLLILTTVVECAKDVEGFLKKQAISAYFEMDVKGFMNFDKPEHRIDNWFSTGRRPVNTIGIFAFIKDAQTDGIVDGLRQLSNDSRINLKGFVVNVEETI